jgi:hypothetical protein
MVGRDSIVTSLYLWIEWAMGAKEESQQRVCSEEAELEESKSVQSDEWIKSAKRENNKQRVDCVQRR